MLAALRLFICAAGFVAASAIALAQLPPIINRDPEFNQFGDDVLRETMARTWGGVVMQATVSLRNEDGSQVDPATLGLSVVQRAGVDGFCLNIRDVCHWNEIDRGSLIALVRWISSDGTGAYSAFRLADEVVRRAGLTRLRNGHFVPIEFKDTRLADLLEGIDFQRALDTDRDTSDILARRQAQTAGARVLGPGAWMITDIDSDFRATVRGDILLMEGVPYRYDWSSTSGDFIHTSRVTAFFSPEDLDRRRAGERPAKAELFSLLTAARSAATYELTQAFFDDLLEAVVEEQREEDREIDLMKSQVVLFRMTALLRTVQRESRAAWRIFLEEITTTYRSEIAERVRIEATF